jgi:hypothetical protein
MTLEFSGQIFGEKTTELLIFWEIHLVGAELFSVRSDSRTDITYLMISFRNFVKASKNLSSDTGPSAQVDALC